VCGETGARAPLACEMKRARGEGEVERARTTRVLELYCGVGAMHFALRRVTARKTDVVGAFDVNPNACDAYEMNHGVRPVMKSLVSVPLATLEKYDADAWVMSPPCQPFTRQGLKLDVDDGRAESFMRLVDCMGDMKARPKYIFVENVVGFETSRMRDALLERLREFDFHVQEFILTPKDFGVPYSRPRYFLCARSTAQFSDAVDGIRRSPPSRALSHRREWIPSYDAANDANLNVAPLARFLDSCGDDSDDKLWRDHAVKQVDVDRAIGTIDIVSAFDVTSNCFTKSYFKYIKGTGSVVSNKQVDKTTWDGVIGEDQGAVRLRYFTVNEVARLHSFPSDFKWPETLSKRQRYTLLGNSMSVACVAPLLDYLFAYE